MLINLTKLVVIIVVLGVGLIQAQDTRITHQPQENVVISGEEVVDLSANPKAELNGTPVLGPVSAGGLTFVPHNITNRATGYDLQSNASTQQVWVDPTNPDFVHAVFTNSQVFLDPWPDRTCLYFGSTDFGVNWFELGPVPLYISSTNGRSGFPAIVGTSGGSAVITNHTNSNSTPVYSKVQIDASPFEYNFTEYDPGPAANGNPIWGRLGIDASDKIYLTSSISPSGPGIHLNTLTGGVWSGWVNWLDYDLAETYGYAVSDGGKVGFMCIGATEAGDVFYFESTDQGVTWSAPLKIWDAATVTTDSTLACLRGGSVSFYGEEPCVTFELSWNTATGYYPGLPSEVRFWSPNINGGVSKVLADSNNVPYYENYGVADVQYPVCRPVIGRSASLDYLFVAFGATTGDYWPGGSSTDSTAYYAGWFMYSADGGDTWIGPERFTPYPPAASLLDFRYPSIAPINAVEVADDDIIKIHIVMQGDSIPGSTVNAAGTGMPVGVTAQYYHFSADLLVVNADPDPVTVYEFNLEQNYPNPFNPSTSIKYSLAEASDVSLKVYDVLGKEVATLVNSTQNTGSYDVNFDASNLASGLYIYTLQTGNFVSSKKMMLLK